MPADRDWVFPRRGLMAWCNYPQPSGRGNLQEFVLVSQPMQRRGCSAGCGATTAFRLASTSSPFKDFAPRFGRLPLGKCETVKKEGGCVARRQADAKTMPAIYAVNTAGRPACVEIWPVRPVQNIANALHKRWSHPFSPQGKTTVKLDAYQMNVLSTEPN